MLRKMSKKIKSKASFSGTVFVAVLFLFCFSGVHGATDVTADNIKELAAGRPVFLKFFAPWCGHCKKMAPAWSELMDTYAESPALFVGKVDCTSSGKSFCKKLGVRGYPTVKHGDLDELKDFRGVRTAENLIKFAKNIQISCIVATREGCSDDENAIIDEVIELKQEDLTREIEIRDTAFTSAKEDHDKKVALLQNQLDKEKQAFASHKKVLQDTRYHMIKSVLNTVLTKDYSEL